MKEVVAIIPARGGSKRIPGKNIRPFLGRPIIGYSIDAALKSNLFDRVIVSTDSEKIAEIASSFGAEIPFFRPQELSDDFTGTDPVVLQTLEVLKDRKIEVSHVCCIYPTAPFIRIEYLKKGLEILMETDADSAFSVTTFPYPIMRGLRRDKNGRIKMIWPEHFNTRSQDLEEAYHDAGQFYWARTDRYAVNRRFFSDNAIPVILPRHLVHDIDTEEDWALAELMFKNIQLSIK